MSLFVREFKSFAIISTISGLYIPDVEFFRIPKSLIRYFLSLLAITCPWITAIDTLRAALCCDFNKEERLFQLSCMLTYGLSAFLTTYWFLKFEKVTEIFRLWDKFNNDCPRRNADLRRGRKLVTSITLLYFFFQVSIYIGMSLIQLFQGTLYFPSSFNSDLKSLKAPFYIVFYQNFGSIYGNACWMTFEMTFMLILNIAFAEINYLNKELQSLSTDFTLKNIKGSTFLKNQARHRLNRCLERHGLLLLWMGKIRNHYQYPILAIYIFIIAASCGFFFETVNGLIATSNMIYGTITSFIHMSALLICSIFGQRIENEGKKLYWALMQQSYIISVKEFKQDILIFQLACSRSLNVNFKGYLPLNLVNFRKIFLLQYRVFTFLTNSMS